MGGREGKCMGEMGGNGREWAHASRKLKANIIASSAAFPSVEDGCSGRAWGTSQSRSPGTLLGPRPEGPRPELLSLLKATPGDAPRVELHGHLLEGAAARSHVQGMDDPIWGKWMHASLRGLVQPPTSRQSPRLTGLRLPESLGPVHARPLGPPPHRGCDGERSHSP
jgi:hypothetical protein